ncbi:hypothetical protein A3749_04670 [Oleiphilus sp. HI0078]|uniref:alpha/beta hydrolase n=2 Tax=Oleiphilus TaxID=141450 RepID=UPI0007C37FB4|nr:MULTISPECIES: alpha/beta fold hydrolase [unclassified Oleiphilus]KZY87247.1 hypothetical protein A3743_15040 [Oleiphilus sp. HI0072]KZZ16215.1 hypothetical protein A3749_04670 [Oleiphilus sp. HI0078]KZY28016.1 hypothetical protein A3729_14290 [Oleiphilus sp. HI0043]KZY39133.1 hypothetical protein A3729_25080 [Oleiphilus sp. HI0043]KZZ71628.1 hypothetical protein A3763_10965 [Oleiphilus sp. HI0128]
MSLSSKAQCLLEEETSRFINDYQEHFLKGETKPPEIGQPYLLHQPQATQGVLLVHGLMAAPEEVREWADYLYSQGYTVYAPRMDGHGTSADDLSRRKMSEWTAAVNRGHEILKHCCEHIVIAGFSTGAAVALKQVIDKPDAFDALVSISAPLKFKKFSANFAKPVNTWNKVLRQIANPVFDTKKFRKEFVTNHADNPHINYLRCPVSSIVEIKKLMNQVQKGLSSITIPTLVIHADKDPKVDVQSGRDIYKSIHTGNAHYREIDFHLHGIVRGDITKKVFSEVNTFLDGVYRK